MSKQNLTVGATYKITNYSGTVTGAFVKVSEITVKHVNGWESYVYHFKDKNGNAFTRLLEAPGVTFKNQNH